MADLDLKTIWQQGVKEDHSLPTVQAAAHQLNKKSIHLVEQIKSTARTEHRIFLILSIIGLIVLSILGQYFWSLGVLLFAGLMIWKYEAEMRLFSRIQPENNTLTYLKDIQKMLHQFMRNYQIGILLLVPLAVTCGMLLVQWLINGTLNGIVWQKPETWLMLLASIGLGILLSRLWLNFWVSTLYGQKLKEIGEMIGALSGQGDSDEARK